MENVKQKKTKAEIIKISVVATVLGILGLIIAFGGLIIGVKMFFRLPNAGYYNASVGAFVIPGTDDGLVAQGMDYDQANDQYIVTGYMKDGSASPVYLLSKDDDGEYTVAKRVTLTMKDGNDYKGHGGGIALANGYLYITGDVENVIHIYKYDDLVSAADGAKVGTAIEPLSLTLNGADYIEPAFVTAVNADNDPLGIKDYLIVGEFYRKGTDYETPEGHWRDAANGEKNRALAMVYPLNPLGDNLDDTIIGGILGDLTYPVKEAVAAFSLPNQVQGMTVYGDRVYLSTSWSLSRSHILTYDATKITPSATSAPVTIADGKTVPVYLFDSSSLISDRKIPPMSEEMAVVSVPVEIIKNGEKVIEMQSRLLVMCESASDKYIFGKYTGGEFCYATKLDFFEKN